MEIKKINWKSNNQMLNTKKKYFCETCDFNTSYKTRFSEHLLTSKHTDLIKWKSNGNKGNQKHQKNQIFICNNCDKVYATSSGLWKHNKKCSENKEDSIQELKNELAEIKTLLQSQNQLIVSNNLNHNNNQLINPQQNQLQPATTSTHITGNHNNIQNNIFNTQVFLENECKNAVNIDDIIEKVIIDVDKLDVFKEKGTSIGIANILNEVLKGYNIYERPIHCSDLKRLSMHVKDNDTWLSKKQGEEKLTKTIHYIQQSVMKHVYDWEDFYKNKMNPDNLDKAMGILIKRTTNLLTDDDNKKIIRTIAPNVKLDASNTNESV